ncbi:hypothetical protein LTR08_005657 [Meristemomyces frigidus]|nr:hypothetical protein LTR08_005657 [Meristemomyces frigidus]
MVVSLLVERGWEPNYAARSDYRDQQYTHFDWDEPSDTGSSLYITAACSHYRWPDSGSGPLKLRQPGQQTTINNTLVSVSSGDVAIGGNIPSAAGSDEGSTGAVLTLGGSQVTAIAVGSSGVVQVAGQTLTPGQVVTIDGQVVGAAPTGLVVDGSTADFSQAAASLEEATWATSQTSGAIITADSQTFTAISSNGAVILGGNTLTPGQVATVSGHTVSDASTGLVIDGSILPFSRLAGTTDVRGYVSLGAVIMEGPHSYTALERSGTVFFDGHTLIPGEQTVINGHIVSDASTAWVADGTTHTFSQIVAAPISGVVWTVGTDVITAPELSNSDFVIQSTT